MNSYAVFTPEAVARLKVNYAADSNVSTFVNTIVNYAYSSRSTTTNAMKVMDIEGNLASTDAVLVNSDMDILISSALRFRLTGDRSSIRVALHYMMSWTSTYVPIGNPITEEVFYKLICGFDLIKDYISNRYVKLVNGFLIKLYVTGKAFCALRSAALSHSNFESRHVMLTAAIGHTLNDRTIIQYSSDLFDSLVDLNILAAGTVTTSIPYVIEEASAASHLLDVVEAGSTFDFVHRDAMEYHIASIEGLILASFVAKNNGADWYGRTSIQGKTLGDGVVFSVEFADGSRPHTDFANSFVTPFDDDRIALFDPVNAKDMINIASMVDPSYIGMFSLTSLSSWKRLLYYSV